jgi:hypothetical protein
LRIDFASYCPAVNRLKQSIIATILVTMTTPSPGNGNQGVKGMPWPSLETASRVSDIANFIFVASLVAGVMSTVGIVWMANVKEAHWDALRKESDREIAQLNKETAIARSQIAEADAKAAEANEKAETERLARVKIEQRLADRALTDEQLSQISNKIKKFSGQEYGITTYWDLKECMAISNRIAVGLERGGWRYVKPTQATFMLGGTEGVQVWVHPDADDSVKKAAVALVTALNDEDMDAVLKEQNPANPKDNKIHLNIGTKPLMR